jgi:hypothetical protein
MRSRDAHSSPNEDPEGQYNDSKLFQDDVEEEDLSYYWSITIGMRVRGRVLTERGPPRPDPSNVSKLESSCIEGVEG